MNWETRAVIKSNIKKPVIEVQIIEDYTVYLTLGLQCVS